MNLFPGGSTLDFVVDTNSIRIILPFRLSSFLIHLNTDNGFNTNDLFYIYIYIYTYWE